MKSIEIKKFVAKVKKFNKGNNTLPILDNVLIKDQMLIVSNLTIVYKVRFPELSPGLFGMIDIKFLEQIAKKTKEIDLNELGKIKTNKGTFEYNPEIKSAIDFPEPEKFKKKLGKLKSETIAELKKAVNFVSKDELRPAMCGVNLNENELCGTDAHIMYFKKHKSTVKGDFIIPINAINILNENDYEISGDVYHGITFKQENEIVFFKPINDKYPNYKSVIPTENPNVIEINKKDFLDAVSVAEISANQVTKHILLNIVNGTVYLKTSDPDYGRSYNGVLEGAKYKGDDFQIGFSSGLMIKGLKYLSNDLKIEMSLPNRALILNECFLLMPAMISNY